MKSSQKANFKSQMAVLTSIDRPHEHLPPGQPNTLLLLADTDHIVARAGNMWVWRRKIGIGILSRRL